MTIMNSVHEIKDWRHAIAGKTVGFVPTMGALHEGHLSLIARAKQETDITVVSIYVNETQFDDPQDLSGYPKSLEEDIKKLQTLGVDCLFLPQYSEVYPDAYRFRVHENKESLELCGKDRPGHFDGVLTIVMKLFNIIKPTKAFFGEKDYQQLNLVRGMVEAFFMDTQIIACPTLRSREGLALSSRNKKLDRIGLDKAKRFAKQLKNVEDLNELKARLQEQEIHVDYIQDIENRRYAAVKIGAVRLIDNVEL